MSSLPNRRPQPERRRENHLANGLCDEARAKQEVERRERLIRRYGRYAEDILFNQFGENDDELTFRVYFDIEESHLTIHGVELYRICDKRPTIQQRAFHECRLEQDLDEQTGAWEELTSKIWARNHGF